MRRRMAAAACLMTALLAVPRVGAADEPFWNSRPLGYWLNQLRVGDPAERAQAARGVGEIALANGGSSVVAAVPLLMPCLDAADAPLRAAAADALGPIGTRAEPAGPRLLSLFERDPDVTVRRAAGVAAARVDPGSVALVQAAGRVLTGDQDRDVRAVAAAALIEAGAAASPALPSVRVSLSDSNPMVRIYSAAILARLGDSATAVPLLLEGLSAHDPVLRAESAGLLGDAAPADRRSVPALIAALGDEERQVRLAAADALGNVGHAAGAAIDPLWRLIHDPDEDVRDHALRALRLVKE
jgi:HEAT repeat protein